MSIEKGVKNDTEYSVITTENIGAIGVKKKFASSESKLSRFARMLSDKYYITIVYDKKDDCLALYGYTTVEGEVGITGSLCLPNDKKVGIFSVEGPIFLTREGALNLVSVLSEWLDQR